SPAHQPAETALREDCGRLAGRRRLSCQAAMPHLHLTRQRRLSAFRRLAIGTWRAPRDPQAYGRVTLDVAAANRYIAAFRAATGKHLTITHMMAKAAGRLLAAVP